MSLLFQSIELNLRNYAEKTYPEFAKEITVKVENRNPNLLRVTVTYNKRESVTSTFTLEQTSKFNEMCESVFSELSFKSPEPESTLWYNSGVKISTPTWSISPSMLFLEQLKPALTIKELEVKEVLRILPLPITNEILEYYI